MLRIGIGYPSEEEEEQIILSQGAGHPIDALGAVVSPDEILGLRPTVAGVHVAPDLRHYVTQFVRATRDHAATELGVSPRGSLALYHGAQAYAFIRGRDFVLPDDVKYLAPFVLAHRIILSSEARLRGRSAEEIIADVAQRIPVPVEAI
jgi:MoxR-like ATPase